MANYIDVSFPLPSDTVGYSFMSGGSVSLDAPAPANSKIVCKLYDSSSTQIGADKEYTITPGMTMVPWWVQFTVNQDYDDVKVSAEIWLNNAATGTTDEVENVDVNDDAGGGFQFP